MWLFQALTLHLCISVDLPVSKGNVHSNIYVHFQESKAHVKFLEKEHYFGHNRHVGFGMCEETGRRERDKVNVKSTYTTVDEQTDNRKTVPPAWRNRKKKDDMVLEEEHKTSNVTFMGEVLDIEESSGQVSRGHDLADDEVELHTDNGKVERHGQCEESEADLKEMIMQQREKGLILITVRKEKPQLYQPVVKLEKKQREICDEPQLCSNQKTNITNFHANSLQTSPSKACASVPSNVNPEYVQDGKKVDTRPRIQTPHKRSENSTNNRKCLDPSSYQLVSSMDLFRQNQLATRNKNHQMKETF